MFTHTNFLKSLSLVTSPCLPISLWKHSSAMHRRHLPSIWKHAYDYMETNLKGSSRNEISNCRPISVLPVVSRLFEKLVYMINCTRILVQKNHIHSDQSVFRSFHSVLICLQKCANDWYLNIDKGQCTSATFLMLQRHSILLNIKYL